MKSCYIYSHHMRNIKIGIDMGVEKVDVIIVPLLDRIRYPKWGGVLATDSNSSCDIIWLF